MAAPPEDDDDETFGDFTFAANNDDEWGDFVKSPQQSKPSDNLYFNGNHSPHSSVSPHTPWAKPTGALPLSIFGDVEGDDDDEEEHKYTAAADFNLEKTNGKAANLTSTHDLSIANLYDRNSQIKPQNGVVDSVLVQNGFYSTSDINSMKSSLSEWGNVNYPATVGTGDHTQLTNKSGNGDFSFKSGVLDPSPNVDIFSVWTGESNGSTSNLTTTTPNVLITGSDLDMNDTTIDDDDDDGGDEWEFKDADSEFQSVQVDNNVDFVDHRVSERSAYPSRGVSSPSTSLDLFGTSNGSIDLFAPAAEPIDYFATSSGVSSISQEVDLIAIQPSTGTLNGFITDTYSNIKQNNTESMLSPSLDFGVTEFDEDFGDFAAATETVPETVNASEVDVLSPSKNIESTADGKIQDKDMKFNYHEGAFPLSIFGYEEPENGGSSDFQDAFMNQSAFNQRNSHTPTTAISVNDLISSLYSQAEQTAPVNTVEKPAVFSDAISSSDVVNDADHLDDTSWDFKHASQTTFDARESPYNIEDTYPNISSKLKPSNYLDFYSKLKEELCFFAKCHIENMKQAQDSAALIGEDASLDSEIQELEQMNFFEGNNLPDHPAGISYLHELVEVLLQPEFQILESEYHLSHKLLQVEKDPRLAIELIRHTATMFKILTIGTLEERTTYISVWSEIVSVCAQELKHGASIWNQALEKHVQNLLKSEPQGRKLILALGEIYRVVVVVGASAKLFKPWALQSEAIYTLIEECHTVWSTSGLEEALSSVSAETAMDDVSLLESIKYIHGLDALALQSYVFTEKGSLCRLSILNEKVAPGMKMIKWGEEQCFVTLANAWSNLISRDPPKLPQLNIG